jgi:hypothetical protein
MKKRIIGGALVAAAVLVVGTGVAVAASGGPGGGPRGGGPLAGAAEYLGLTREQLRDALEDDKSLAQIAREQGKSVDGLKQAIRAEAEEKLSEAVAAGRLTEAQKSQMLERLDEHLDELVNATGPPFRGGCDGERPANAEPAGIAVPL